MTDPQHRDLVSASKFMSLVLRHAPETIGLGLDENGWAEVDQLLAKAALHGKALTRADLLAVVADSDKQRFALSPDGQRIRANQGHSIAAVDLALTPVAPPEFLYHGTASRFLASIVTTGLRPGSRNHVHLSLQTETAVNVATRHGKPVVLTVLAGAMHAAGHLFYLSENKVWLTANVPPQFIRFD
ncbi:MAG: RNA 2'-phosphotransferase [Massilia sp.]